jgi:formyltetrahydrofolate deformylase
MANSFILTLSCQDRPGIVAAVTTELHDLGANIDESNQFCDRETGRFFMRLAFQAPDQSGREGVERALKPAIERFQMKTEITDVGRTPRMIIMVSKFDHAMRYLLYQIRVGWLRAEVVGIVSNHPDSREIADFEGIPFYYWPITKDNKDQQEENLLDLVNETEADLVVLARYMQVLSDKLTNRLFGKTINIHHSFLPAFKGSKPYQQAHDRGVKLIGATAHFVTPELDEGPIIEQETERVSHAMTVDDFVATGRDIESRVLGRAVRLQLDCRVMLNGHKTVVFMQ